MLSNESCGDEIRVTESIGIDGSRRISDIGKSQESSEHNKLLETIFLFFQSSSSRRRVIVS